MEILTVAPQPCVPNRTHPLRRPSQAATALRALTHFAPPELAFFPRERPVGGKLNVLLCVGACFARDAMAMRETVNGMTATSLL